MTFGGWRGMVLAVPLSFLVFSLGLPPQQAGAQLRLQPIPSHRDLSDEDRQDQDAPESFTKGFKALKDDALYLSTSPTRMTSHDAFVLGGVFAGIGGLLAADHGIQRFMQKNTSATGRDGADVFNGIGSPVGILGLNAGLIAVGVTNWSYTGDSRLKNAALVSLESEIFTMASVFVIKEVVGRATPNQNKGATHFRPFSGDDSFPSGHAAVSFATAAVFADRFEQPVRGIAYGLASTVALARVYSDKHFASDVVVGGLLGWVVGKALSARHSYLDSDIEIRPFALGRGEALGLMVVKHF